MKPARSALFFALAAAALESGSLGWAASAAIPPVAGKTTEPPPASAPATSGPFQEEGGRAITLDEAYRLSLKRTETIAENEESYNEALANVDYLKSSVLPHVAFLGQQIYEESPNIPGFPIGSSLPQYQLQATQPLFSGFREFLAFKMGKRQAESAELTYERAKSLLYQDVAQAYLNLLQQQKEIVIRQSVVRADNERIKQLEYWVRIGRSRDSEVLAAKAQLAQTEAQIEITRGQERVAQETLRFLTGLDERLIPQEMPLPALDPIDGFLARARQRTDVQAAAKNLEASQLYTRIQSRQRWPTVGAVGDYYLERNTFYTNVHYDAILNISMPLFDSGLISSQVKSAQAAERSNEEALSYAARGAERDIRSNYRNLEGTLASAAALQKAADLGEANVQAQVEDYKRSLVTNLDVLDAVNNLESIRLLLNQNELQAILSRAQLEVAAGGPEIIKP